MTLLLPLAFLAFGFVCFALGLWVGREGGRRESRTEGKMIYG